ncbi:PhoX family protein [Nocardioides insulae]|uniref:PhoX family protein n=1 Tax=Nocardioides insulae TaxID=394734 RepID=UPI0003FD2994|nr:PhoX family phosphatase [Nocardioides insulae]
MTTAPERRSLPLFPVTRHGSRSYATCFYRCGNACDHPEPNRSEHPHVRDVVNTALQRRSLVKGAAVGGGALVLAGLIAGPAVAGPGRGHGNGPGPGHGPGRGPGHGNGHGSRGGGLGRVDVEPVAPNVRDAFTVPKGLESEVVMRWGDPVVPGATQFDPHRQSVASARAQFGYNCDYVGLIPLDSGDRPGTRALLVVNHEYTNEELMFPADTYSEDDIRRIAMASHGMSVVTLERGRTPGSWRPVSPRRTRHNRRFHDATEFAFTGPVAGHDLVRTSADRRGRTVLGTFNNCAGGSTPWGTVLSGEENFNQYFSSSTGTVPAQYATEYARYGISATGGAARNWAASDPRFDLATEPHEAHRFGWVVEIDPLDPHSTPVKHTMLGRFKHEGANVIVNDDRRVVAYMGDDERGDYLYKFVSQERYLPSDSPWARRHNKLLLTEGTLYVARLTGDGTEDGVHDGTGEWIRLATHRRSYVPGMSLEEVLVFTRLAADKVAPTRMDRPEDVEPNPWNGKVYAALTNNSNRGQAGMEPDEANPLASSMVRSQLGAPLTAASGNRNGYVLEMTPHRGDHASDRFTWDLFLVCGDPEAPETYFAGYDKSKVSPISCPDNVAFDEAGNIWISTDGNVLGSNDGVFRVPLSGRDRGRVEQMVTVPRGAEACGPLVADDDRSLFVAVQHPGESDDSTFASPYSTWPHTDDFPRPSVVVSYLAD